MKTTIISRVRQAMSDGHLTGKEVCRYFDKIGLDYNKHSINVRVWEQRKKRGLPLLKATRNVGITDRVRKLIDKGLTTTQDVFKYLDENKITHNKPSVRMIVWTERKKRGLHPKSNKNNNLGSN